MGSMLRLMNLQRHHSRSSSASASENASTTQTPEEQASHGYRIGQIGPASRRRAPYRFSTDSIPSRAVIGSGPPAPAGLAEAFRSGVLGAAVVVDEAWIVVREAVQDLARERHE